MADTIREQIMDAIMSNLTSAPGLAGVLIERGRDSEVDTFPSVIVNDGGHVVTAENHGFDDVNMEVNTELFVAKSAFQELLPALNALYGAVVQAAFSDRKLGGLAQNFDEEGLDEPVIARIEGQGPSAAATIDFTVFYQRAEGDPFNLA